MAQAYTTTDFLNTVRLRGSIPNTTNTSNVNNTANLLQLATEEMLIKLVPLIMSVREEFFVTHTDYTITSGTAAYPIPYRAIGQICRDVQIISGNSVFKLSPIEQEYITTTNTGDVLAYYFENNNIILYPTPGSSTQGTLRVSYFSRPSQLVATSACGQITGLTATTVTLNAVPSTFTVGGLVDFVRATPPYDNSAQDQAITGIAGSVLTFASLPTATVGGLNVGDWVALSEQSPIPQVPREFQAVLAQMTVVKVLQAQGDMNGANQANADLKIIQANALSMLSQRNEGSNKKVISRNWYRR